MSESSKVQDIPGGWDTELKPSISTGNKETQSKLATSRTILEILDGTNISDAHHIDRNIWYGDVTPESGDVAMTTYTTRMIVTYTNAQYVDHDLFVAFQEDFGDCTLEMFQKVYKPTLRALKLTLRYGGVFTGRNNGPNAPLLFELAHAEDLPIWPEKELNQAIVSSRSRARQFLLKHMQRFQESSMDETNPETSTTFDKGKKTVIIDNQASAVKDKDTHKSNFSIKEEKGKSREDKDQRLQSDTNRPWNHQNSWNPQIHQSIPPHPGSLYPNPFYHISVPGTFMGPYTLQNGLQDPIPAHLQREFAFSMSGGNPANSTFTRLPTAPPTVPTVQQPNVANSPNDPYAMYSITSPYSLPPLNIPNDEVDRNVITTFVKAFSGSKYTGEAYDLLDDKVRKMMTLCRHCNIRPSQFWAVFPTILTAEAEDYYNAAVTEYDTFAIAYFKLKTHFDTAVNYQRYNEDWMTINYRDLRKKDCNQNPQETLDEMFKKLQLCQRALGPVVADDFHLQTALKRSVENCREFKDAMYRPAQVSGQMKADMRTALNNYLKYDAPSQALVLSKDEQDNSQYYLDRRYTDSRGQAAGHGRSNNSRTFQPRGGRYFNRRSSSRRLTSRSNNKKCFVCGKEGCWSWNHPKQQREKVRNQYLAQCEFSGADDSQEGFLAFISQFEGPKSAEQWLQGFDDEASDVENDTADDEDSQGTVQYMVDHAFLHHVTGEDIFTDTSDQPAHQFVLDRYSRSVFQGILPDTGAATFSTAGHDQFIALRHELPDVKLDTSTAGDASIQFGKGDSSTSIGTVTLNTPIGTITFHVLNTTTPFLLCLNDMDKLGVFLRNTTNELVKQDGTTVPVIRKWGHPWFFLNTTEAATVFLSEQELRRLHKRFGHPAVRRLHKLLQDAGHSDVDEKLLTSITRFCSHCQMNSQAPRRFKFSLQDERNFNYEIYADVVHINGRNTLHVIDAATSFQAAKFLPSMSAKDTWETLRLLWIDTYQGPPDIISHDPGTNFASAEFRSEAKIMGITCHQVPTEAHWSLGKVERYHAPLRRAFDVIYADLQGTTGDEAILQMAVKAVNDTTGPHGLVPTLLVFGAYPRINIESPPSPSTVKRAAAIQKAMKELLRIRADRQVRDALKQRNGPITDHILSVPLQSEVLVWREKRGWTGPHRVAAVNGHDITIDTINGPAVFRSTVVKPYYRDEDTARTVIQAPITTKSIPMNTVQALEESITPPAVRGQGQIRRRGRPRGSKNKPKHIPPLVDPQDTFMIKRELNDHELSLQLRANGIITTSGAPFEESDRKEVDDLIAQGVFEFVSFDPSKHSGRIFRTRMVREIKGKGKNERPYEKSRLVIQGHSDYDKINILTQSPTIQRVSQRIILALAATLIQMGMSLALRDISQAFIQSKSSLFRPVFAYLPTELKDKYPQNTILHVVKPLYSIAEAGVHWFTTYHSHHVNELQMSTSTFDHCFLIANMNFGLIGMQVDDTIILGDNDFQSKEEEKLCKAQFRAKPKTILSTSTPFSFNGLAISVDTEGSIRIRQKDQGKKLAVIDVHSENKKQKYIEQRARGAYIAALCQPEASYDMSVAAQATDPSETDVEKLNRRLYWQLQHQQRGLSYIPLQLQSAKLFVFTDGSFANNRDMTSQIGYLIVLANETYTANNTFTIKGNILHWSSTKCKRVTRSVLASEIYGMANGFDIGMAISTSLHLISAKLNIPAIPVVVCTDSLSLYECLVKLGTTKERRLMVDVMALRQAYERREIADIRWIHGSSNPADAFTKQTPNKALQKLVDSNELVVEVKGRVERSSKGTEVGNQQ